MKVLMFQPQFAVNVESGSKTRTIRGKRKRPCQPGDLLSLRAWTGKPYRSKQRFLKAAICQEVHEIEIRFEPTIDEHGKVACCYVDGKKLTMFEWEDLAQKDGFEKPQFGAWGASARMLIFFEQNHGLPFKGDMIQW